ncbi:hypothetical protein J5S49_17620 [Virgibacillus halodenitrificans]|uniref:hypothetical protein n=1 Tax=Virgibacillus halodenitrificans TaxID=1482 RepID=UPI001F2570ED|nr:hypothetical protein [Virgibacillus halodenitrificans]MCG1030104.1 hypothetical protein [Virgibacillus halodenitrificans]
MPFIIRISISIVVGKGRLTPIKIKEKKDIKVMAMKKAINLFLENTLFSYFLRLAGRNQVNSDKDNIKSSAGKIIIPIVPYSSAPQHLIVMIISNKRKNKTAFALMKNRRPVMYEVVLI